MYAQRSAAFTARTKMSLTKIAIIIPSIDRYSFLWPGITSRVSKIFSFKCKKLLIAQEMVGSINGFEICSLGADYGWNQNTFNVVSSITEEYVLLILDDAPPITPISEEKMSILVRLMEKEGLNYLNLKGIPEPKGAIIERDLAREILATQKFKASLHLSIWKREELLLCLKKYDSPWALEWDKNNFIAYRPQRYASLINDARIKYDHIVIGGKVDFKSLSRLYTERVEMRRIKSIELTLHRLKILCLD